MDIWFNWKKKQENLIHFVTKRLNQSSKEYVFFYCQNREKKVLFRIDSRNFSKNTNFIIKWAWCLLALIIGKNPKAQKSFWFAIKWPVSEISTRYTIWLSFTFLGDISKNTSHLKSRHDTKFHLNLWQTLRCTYYRSKSIMVIYSIVFLENNHFNFDSQ